MALFAPRQRRVKDNGNNINAIVAGQTASRRAGRHPQPHWRLQGSEGIHPEPLSSSGNFQCARCMGGLFTKPQAIFLTKSTHWINSGLHIAQARGGEFLDGPGSVATCATCCAILRWQIQEFIGGETAEGLSNRGVYTIFVGAQKAFIFPGKAAKYHTKKHWRDHAAGHCLGVGRLFQLLPPSRAASAYPGRADLRPVSRRGKKALLKKTYDRFSKSSASTRTGNACLIFGAYRVHSLRNTLPSLKGRLAKYMARRRAPLLIQPDDKFWGNAVATLEEAWSFAAAPL